MILDGNESNPWFSEESRDFRLAYDVFEFYAILDSVAPAEESGHELLFDALEAEQFEEARLFHDLGIAAAEALAPVIMRLSVDLDDLEDWTHVFVPTSHDIDFDDTQWFRLSVNDDGRGPSIVQHESVNDAAGVLRYLHGLQPVSPETDLSLRDFMSLPRDAVATDDAVADIFRWEPNPGLVVTVYDVGQGSATAICDSGGTPHYYFDLGGGALNNTSTYPYQPGDHPFCADLGQAVVLSHWDMDHWVSGHRLSQYTDLPWIVPSQALGATHLKFASSLYAKGNLHVWAAPSGTTIVNTIGLMQRCTGRGRNDSGIALLVYDPAQPTQGSTLLPGDCSYWFIPSDGSGSLKALVAAHHGGVIRGRAYVPMPMPGARAAIAFSYGQGNSYGHPRGPTVALHKAAGWAPPDLFYTAADGTSPRGDIAFFRTAGPGASLSIAHQKSPTPCTTRCLAIPTKGT